MPERRPPQSKFSGTSRPQIDWSTRKKKFPATDNLGVIERFTGSRAYAKETRKLAAQGDTSPTGDATFFSDIGESNRGESRQARITAELARGAAKFKKKK